MFDPGYSMEKVFDFQVFNDPNIIIIVGMMRQQDQKKFSIVYSIITYKKLIEKIEPQAIFSFKALDSEILSGSPQLSLDLPGRMFVFLDPMLNLASSPQYQIAIFLEYKKLGEEEQLLVVPLILNIQLSALDMGKKKATELQAPLQFYSGTDFALGYP